jgi:hypothetical protein
LSHTRVGNAKSKRQRQTKQFEKTILHDLKTFLELALGEPYLINNVMGDMKFAVSFEMGATIPMLLLTSEVGPAPL